MIDPAQSPAGIPITKVTRAYHRKQAGALWSDPDRGNTITREHHPSRSAVFKEGDLFDRNKAARSRTEERSGDRCLRRCAWFPIPAKPMVRAEARMKRLAAASQSGAGADRSDRALRQLGELGIYVGVSTDNPLYSSANWHVAQRAWHRRSEVELRGELGIRVQSLLARVAAPRLWNPFVRLDVRGFWRNENTQRGQVIVYANAELTRFCPRRRTRRRLPPTLRCLVIEFNISQILVPLYRGELDGCQPGWRSSQSLKFSGASSGIAALALKRRRLLMPQSAGADQSRLCS